MWSRRRVLRLFGASVLAWGLSLRQVRAEVTDAVVRVRPGESIQRAIDVAPAGATVRVDPGFYQETVIIDRPLRLIAEGGPDVTLICADKDRFDYEGRRTDDMIVGAINVVRTEHVTVSGFRVTGALEGIWLSTSRDTCIKNCVAFGNESSGFYYWACENGLIKNCLAYDNAVGAYEGQSWNVSLEDSAFFANRGGVAPHLGRYGLSFPGIGILCGNRSRHGRILGCELAGNAAVGVQINARVLDKEIASCSVSSQETGIALGERAQQVVGCNIFGNRVRGMSSSYPIDARGNWWGDPTGPSGAGPGRGDAVSEQVDFDPWLKSPAKVNGAKASLP